MKNRRFLFLTLGLIGMSDFLFHPAVKVPAAPKELFSIVLDHEPLRPEQARDAGADLYLSGHTHAGQFWLIGLFTRRLFALDRGSRMFGQMTAVVTNGFGCWGAPFRLGARAEVVLLHLVETTKAKTSSWSLPRCY